jgi:hypothetical protein
LCIKKIQRVQHKQEVVALRVICSLIGVLEVVKNSSAFFPDVKFSAELMSYVTSPTQKVQLVIQRLSVNELYRYIIFSPPCGCPERLIYPHKAPHTQLSPLHKGVVKGR